MLDTPGSVQPLDVSHTARRFFAIQELLGSPELARLYTDLLINSPTTITAARERHGLSKSNAYKDENKLEE
jgi:hypothetical protein